MKLTPRLEAIAEFIPAGSVVADIGTDHGYLPVYLLLEQISQHAVASDIHAAPLEQARETIAAFNCLQKIDLRLGDGLHVLKDEDKVDTVVISGMGGRTIARLLGDGAEKLTRIQRVILQPMNETGYLRLFLANHGYALVQESLVMEGKHLYEVIMAKPGTEKEKDPFRVAVGPRLLEKKPPLLPLLLQEKIRKLRIVCNSLKKARQSDVSRQINEAEQRLRCLEEVLASAVERTKSDVLS